MMNELAGAKPMNRDNGTDTNLLRTGGTLSVAAVVRGDGTRRAGTGKLTAKALHNSKYCVYCRFNQIRDRDNCVFCRVLLALLF